MSSPRRSRPTIRRQVSNGDLRPSEVVAGQALASGFRRPDSDGFQNAAVAIPVSNPTTMMSDESESTSVASFSIAEVTRLSATADSWNQSQYLTHGDIYEAWECGLQLEQLTRGVVDTSSVNNREMMRSLLQECKRHHRRLTMAIDLCLKLGEDIVPEWLDLTEYLATTVKNARGQSTLDASVLAESRNIMGLMVMLRNMTGRQQVDAGWELLKFVRRAAQEGDEESLIIRSEVYQHGGIDVFLDFVTGPVDYELRVVAALAVAYILPSMTQFSSYRLRYAFQIIKCLEFLSSCSAITIRQLHVKNEEAISACAIGFIAFWNKFLEVCLLQESENTSEELRLVLSMTFTVVNRIAESDERTKECALTEIHHSVQRFTVDVRLAIEQMIPLLTATAATTGGGQGGAHNALMSRMDEALPSLTRMQTTASSFTSELNASASYQQIERSGPPGDPLPFSSYLEHSSSARYVASSVYNPETGKVVNDADNILVGWKNDETPRDRAYWLGEELKPCIYGSVRACRVLKARNDARVPWEVTEQQAAIKMMTWQKIYELSSISFEDPLKEAAVMQLFNIEPHPNVIGAYEVLSDEDYLMIVMPLCQEGALFDRVFAIGQLLEDEAKYWFKQTLAGLEHMQKLGICHRDLSLENVLIGENNTAKIIDFGIALRIPYAGGNDERAADVSAGTLRRLICPQTRCGKLFYMSPEIMASEDPFDGFAIDLWAVAVMLFIMLVGNPPWRAAVEHDENFHVISSGGLKSYLQRIGFDLSSGAEDLLQKMLRRDPRERLSLSQIKAHPWLQT